MEPRIRALGDDEAPPKARPILEATRRAIGMVPNLHRTLAHSPAALSAYSTNVGALAKGELAPALREQVALAVAGTNDCEYCASAHTAIGKSVGLAEDELDRNLRGASEDARAEVALHFVRDLIESRGDVSDARLEAVRDAGFSEAEIVELVAHVALNTFTNLVNRLARTTVDFPRVELCAAS